MTVLDPFPKPKIQGILLLFRRFTTKPNLIQLLGKILIFERLMETRTIFFSKDC
jgi:hypothetical protein